MWNINSEKVNDTHFKILRLLAIDIHKLGNKFGNKIFQKMGF